MSDSMVHSNVSNEGIVRGRFLAEPEAASCTGDVIDLHRAIQANIATLGSVRGPTALANR